MIDQLLSNSDVLLAIGALLYALSKMVDAVAGGVTKYAETKQAKVQSTIEDKRSDNEQQSALIELVTTMASTQRDTNRILEEYKQEFAAFRHTNERIGEVLKNSSHSVELQDKVDEVHTNTELLVISANNQNNDHEQTAGKLNTIIEFLMPPPTEPDDVPPAENITPLDADAAQQQATVDLPVTKDSEAAA